GYMVSGQGEVNLPGMVGFVYFPGVIAVALTTVLFAPLGVKVAHRISPKQLKIIFSLLLIAVSGQMLYSLLTHPVG
ncbi:MAG: sulfite exporter TauE/SafE family protein, partial [Neisseriaceae bacterium]|nr:sulfite exporter TauE/SafE family protein [Neisseriaceae bacterium]